MKRACSTLAVALVLLAALLLGGALAALQDAPMVTAHAQPDYRDVARVVEVLRQNDPRLGALGQTRAAALAERELEVLIAQAASHWLHAASHVSLERGSATVQLSAQLPSNPFGRWLNVELALAETAGLPALKAVRVGHVRLPVALAKALGLALLDRAGLRDELQVLTEVVQQVRFSPRSVGLHYVLRGDSATRMAFALLQPAEQQRLRAYSDLLAALAAVGAADGQVLLSQLMGPMFELARQRSFAGGDAAAENRAALHVLTLYANGMGVQSIAPAAQAWPQARPLRVMLAGREDFPRHFLVSAMLAAEGSGPLSRAVGLYKEVADAHGGSGFSFTDMAANRAGTRFGELAVQEPERVQAGVARGVLDHDLVPRLDDLPEFLSEPEFLRRFGGVGAPGYNALLAQIDRRIAALSLLR